jgi:hypothetical protein
MATTQRFPVPPPRHRDEPRRHQTVLWVLSALALVAALAGAVTVFALVVAAPCDPSLPVLSDGTREAPRPWALAWWAFMLASAACVGVGIAAAVSARSASSKAKVLGIAAGVGLGALIVLWIAGTLWSNQCSA